MHDFPYIHGKFISNTFKEQNYRFYDAYLKLEELSQLYSENNKTYKRNSAQRKLKFEMDFGEDAVTRIANNGQLSIDATYGVQVTLLFKDLYHARLAKFKIQEKIDAERAEAKNLEDSLAAGDMEMCGCCFVEHPMNRMVYCNSTSAVHLFCKSCLTTHAETEVGKGLYKLECISMDNCLGGFAKDQRLLFLTPKLMETMEQLELEESLRLAGIENLETCPFCPYAAEYPPIEENRIFQCARDECMISSCRNCRKEQHIPLTCEEHAKTLGAEHHRHQIEDLMSEALLRKCNKCATPFIKSDGCNKISGYLNAVLRIRLTVTRVHEMQLLDVLHMQKNYN